MSDSKPRQEVGCCRFEPSWEELVSSYENTAETNDRIHHLLENATRSHRLLAGHREYIETHKLGFGDAAFQSMWARILEGANRRHGRVRALEIGVFKGQVISLWSLLAKEYGWNIEISCITPLSGNPRSASRLMNRLRSVLSAKYREDIQNANFYEEANYGDIIRQLFAHFALNFDEVTIHRGLSTDAAVLDKVAEQQYEIVYVDGDHSFEGSQHDFRVFGPKVVKGGWLIADDAGCDLPGTKFWKGHEAVSRAVEILPSLGFRNVLNVGHNRIYERVS
jgi:hypothetical protein